MRFGLFVMLVVCVAGFLLSSGTIALQSGTVLLNTAAVSHSLPVLIALAVPMLVMGVVLMMTMSFGREDRHH